MQNSLSLSSYLDKVEGFSNLSQQEQVRLVAYFYCISTSNTQFTTSVIKQCFIDEDLKLPANISDCFLKLSNTKSPTFIKKSGSNYTFQRDVKKSLDELYLGNKHTQQISTALRSLLTKINSVEQRTFLEEAISCFEIRCYRASIVMAWLLTMDVIYEDVIGKHLVAFNTAIQAHGKYKKITVSKKEDFSDIKESDFIELLRVSKVITNDVRKILDEKLSFRNTAAHPNSISIKETKAISFIEDLIDNIILKFQ